MYKILSLALVSAAMAAPAMAQDRTFRCTMTEACRQDGGNCQPENIPYNFTLNAQTGAGEMEQREGNFFDGSVVESDGAMHFFFTNSAGLELGTITEAGQIIYTGNMAIGDSLIHYRLNGTCSETTGGGGAGGASK